MNSINSLSESLDVFIASSSAGLSDARKIESTLKKYANESSVKIKIRVWADEFENGDITIRKLEQIAEKAHFGIFIFHATDTGRINGKKVKVVRDNVILEYGLFLGKLPIKRCFTVVPDDQDLRLPSDILGVTHMQYSSESANKEDTLNDVSYRIFNQMIKFHNESPLLRFPRMEFEDIFTKTGLSKAYQIRTESTNDMVKDIFASKISLKLYARVYISELVKTVGFIDALANAVNSNKNNYLLRCVFSDRTNESLVKALYEIEQLGNSEMEYFAHMESCEKKCNAAVKSASMQISSKWKKHLIYQKAYINTVLPYSFVVIDDKIVYVSIYNLSRNKFGLNAPTMRLICDNNKSNWAQYFINELSQYNKAEVGSGILREGEELIY